MFLHCCKTKFGMESLGLEPVLYMPALLVLRIFLISHCRDDNPAIADVLAKRAPFFKVALTNLTRLVSYQGHVDHKGGHKTKHLYLCNLVLPSLHISRYSPCLVLKPPPLSSLPPLPPLPTQMKHYLFV